MAPYRLLPLTVALTVAGVCWAGDEAPILKPAANAAAVPMPHRNRQAPVYFTADHLTGLGQSDVEAEGNVFARSDDETFSADWMHYTPASDELFARGDVVFTRGANRMECNRFQLKLGERLGEAEPVTYRLVSNKGQAGRGNADKLVFAGPNQYRLDRASFTTCPAGDDGWLLKSSKLDLDYDRDVGTARNVHLEYLGVPILYSPTLQFALSDARKSGFLTPSIGFSGTRGTEVIAPWYWNIAPNQDATITPRYMTRRGLQIGTEYRYLESSYQGKLDVEALPNDSVTGTGRYHELFDHSQRFTSRLSGSIHIEDVSDDTYFTDLSSVVAQTSTQNLPRQANLSYNGDWWNVSAMVQSYQTLQDPAAPIVPPYQRMPQILASANRNKLFNDQTHFAFSGEMVRFETEQSNAAVGNRLHLYPSLDWDLEQTFGYIHPKVGVDYTAYQLDSNPSYPNALNLNRTLPIASVDSGIYMDRTIHWRGTAYTQTLEPRLYYVWIPYTDQSQLPVFDTSLGDPLQPQLFSENQFIGIDRINDANQLTAGVTSRFVESDSGMERLRLTLGQRYYFTNQRVTLPGYGARDSNVTNLVGEASGQITDRWYFDSGIQYNSQNSQVAQANAGASYRAGHGRLVNLDFRYTNPLYATQEIKQTDLSWQWPITPRWYSLGRLNYSHYDHRLIEGLLGLEHNAGCWTTRFVIQRLVTTTQTASTTFYLQLELNGLTKLGPNPLDVLRNSIPGYTKSDEINPH